MNISRLPLRGTAFVLAVLVSGLPAGPALARAGAALVPPATTITSTGRAAVFEENVSAARDRAVQAALLRAVERYAGLRIESSTLIRKGELVDREVRARTRGFVKAYEIVAERREGAELVVDVKVEVAAVPFEEAFRRLVSTTTTLLLVNEASLGRPVNGQVLPAVLADPFFTAKVVVPPPATLKGATGKLPASFFAVPDPATARELGLRHLAGLVVVASASTKKLDSSAESIGYDVDPKVLRPVVAAEGNITIFSGDSGQTIASRRFDDVRASDASDPERASAKALAILAGQMRAFVVEKLSLHVAELGFRLRVVVKGAAVEGGAQRVKQALEATRWVRRVDIVSEEKGQAVLEATCVEKPYYVVEELRHAGGVSVDRFDATRAEVELK